MEIRQGLSSLPKDSRDYSLAGIFHVDEVPQTDFMVGSSEILDQRNTDFCTGFATCAASAIEESQTLNPFWSFAVSKIGQDINSFGNDLRTACRVHTKYGANNYDLNFSLEDHNADWLRDISNYPKQMFDSAKVHLKKSYFAVDGFGSIYDSIMHALWKFKDKKQVVISGVLWRSLWTHVDKGIINDDSGDGFGHAFIIVGQKFINGQPYAIAQLSNGEYIGDKGYFYISKSVVDKNFTYGSYMFVDLPEGLTHEDAVTKSQYYRAGSYGKLLQIIKKFLCLTSMTWLVNSHYFN